MTNPSITNQYDDVKHRLTDIELQCPGTEANNYTRDDMKWSFNNKQQQITQAK